MITRTPARESPGRMPDFVLGIDLGTSKVAVSVIDGKGNVVRTAARELPRASLTPDGWLTQEPRDWLAIIMALIKEVGQFVPLNQIASLGITATTPSFAFLNEGGQLVYEKAVMWNDLNRIGPAAPSGLGVALQKLTALAVNKPALINQSRWIIDQTNLVGYYCTGLLSTNAATLVQKFNWNGSHSNTEGFERFPIDHLLRMIPDRIVSTGDVLGPLRPHAARTLGLSAGIPVVLCGYDSIAALGGGGLLEPSKSILATVGTSIGLYLIPTDQSLQRSGPWVCRENLLPYGLKVTSGGFEAGMQTIGFVHKKLRLSCKALQAHAVLEKAVAEAEPLEPAETFALPFGNMPLKAPLSNRRLPTIISWGRGLHPDEITKLIALRRGVAYYIRYALEDLRFRDIGVTRIHLVGGGTQSPSFCQSLASICQMPVLDFGPRAAAIGAAVFAATALTGRASRYDLVRRLRQGRTKYNPDAGLSATYNAGYQHFVNHLNACLGIRALPKYAKA